MAINVTLNNVANLQDTTTAQNTINNNNSTLTTALQDGLSRSGSSPNTMSSNLDMNSNRILNLPAPGSQNEPVRLADVTSGTSLQFTFASPTAKVGTGATNGSATSAMRSDAAPPIDQTMTPTWTGFHSFSPSSGLTSGIGISGTTIVSQASGVSSILPSINATLIGTSTTDTLTNKTLRAPSITGGSATSLLLINANATSGFSATNAQIASATLSGTFTGTYTFSGSPTLSNAVITNPTFTGGTIDNTSIGGTTPAAAVFTTITGTAILSTSSVLSSGTGGLGYTTGAGGVVTQGTNKSTSVTSNVLAGRVTVNAAALPGSSTFAFTVNNTQVGLNDAVYVYVASGGTANAYYPWVSSVSAGSFKITVKNNTSSTLSESPIVGFTVIKGATS